MVNGTLPRNFTTTISNYYEEIMTPSFFLVLYYTYDENEGKKFNRPILFRTGRDCHRCHVKNGG